jgi:integrase
MIPHLKRGTHKTCPACGRRGGRSTQFCSKCGKDLRQVDPEGIAERTRIIEVSQDLIDLIRLFLEGSVPDPESFLIDRSRQDIYHIIRVLAEKAGLKGKVIINPETGKSHFLHPHCFRDALAVDWLEDAGDNINKQKALQMHLGHNRFDTTLRYNKLTQSAINKTREEVRDKRGLWDEPKTDTSSDK